MALPNFGSISLDMIAAEFGGSAPHALTEYYRGGTYVGSHNTGVPTSGSISLQDFYGAFLSNFTPTASVNWDNLSHTTFGVLASDTGNSQTIVGIAPSIDLDVVVSSLSIDTDGVSNLYVSVDGGADVLIATADNFGITYTPFNVLPDQTVVFTAEGSGGFSGTLSASYTVTVRNTSDANTTLDTFTVSLSWQGGI